ncbi:MAG: thioredoxin domain-containing protein [Planctomycetota bacterium]
MSGYLSRFVCILAAATVFGCKPQDSAENDVVRSLPVVSGSQLETYVAQSDAPVLVEFGVDFQCERCRQMKTPIVELADRLDGRADVIRVDFNANAALVSQLGGTICPTYVLFQDGQPVHTESFPVSADILEAKVSELVE